jgi:hypothetical protein
MRKLENKLVDVVAKIFGGAEQWGGAGSFLGDTRRRVARRQACGKIHIVLHPPTNGKLRLQMT